MQQENLPITINQKKTITKNMFLVKKIHDDYHKLDRAGKGILIRLRTGHNRLNAHMNKKMKFVPSSMCSCNIEDQTMEQSSAIYNNMADNFKKCYNFSTSSLRKMILDYCVRGIQLRRKY